MLLDANLLLYAVDARSPHHERAADWLEGALNGDRRVGIPWQSIGAFLRISTHPRVAADPLSAEAAWGFVDDWLGAGPAWIPPATERTAAVLRQLVSKHRVTGNLVTDALLAALAVEHGLVLCSADTDFARFDELRWENPLV
jgi:toxin-antitoxin system PIN domain toxin